MRAKITKVDFDVKQIVVSVDVYFTKGESQYAEYLRGDPLEPYPFRNLNFTFPTNVTKAKAVGIIRGKLKALKDSYTKAAAAKSTWVNQEFEF